MMGLFEKDLQLIFSRKQTIILFILISVIMGINMDGSFIISYLSLLCSILAVGTISYDEADNGFPFLFTLPGSRKDYVSEKYLFCAAITFAGWLFSIVIYFIIGSVKGTIKDPVSDLMIGAEILPFILIMASLTILFQLKYGAEKSRIMLITIIGGVIAIIYGIVKFLHISEDAFDAVFEKLTGVSPLLISFLAAAVISFVLYRLSVTVMKNKIF